MSAARRLRYSSGTPWEPKAGYSRAIRVGSRIYVSGTTAAGRDGVIAGIGDPYLQTVRVLDQIETALRALGGSLREVVRIRIYATQLADVDAIARAVRERMGRVRPAATLVAVAGLVDPAMRVEIEADAEVARRARVVRRAAPGSGRVAVGARLSRRRSRSAASRSRKRR